MRRSGAAVLHSCSCDECIQLACNYHGVAVIQSLVVACVVTLSPSRKETFGTTHLEMHAPALAATASAAACRAADGSWPYALLNHKGNDLTYRPQEHLLNNLKSCGLGRRQERKHFIARCVTDMQLVPWTVEAKKGFRSGICRGRGPFRYRCVVNQLRCMLRTHSM